MIINISFAFIIGIFTYLVWMWNSQTKQQDQEEDQSIGDMISQWSILEEKNGNENESSDDEPEDDEPLFQKQNIEKIGEQNIEYEDTTLEENPAFDEPFIQFNKRLNSSGNIDEPEIF